MTIQQKIEQLREELNQHTHNYYVLDNATISDFDFDTTLKELEKLEKPILNFLIQTLQPKEWGVKLPRILQRLPIKTECTL